MSTKRPFFTLLKKLTLNNCKYQTISHNILNLREYESIEEIEISTKDSEGPKLVMQKMKTVVYGLRNLKKLTLNFVKSEE